MDAATLEHERRWVRPAAMASLLGLLTTVAGILLQRSISAKGIPVCTTQDIGGCDDMLRLFDAHQAALWGSTIAQAFSFLALTPLVLALFVAARNRVTQGPRNLIGLVVLGPVLLAIVTVLYAAVRTGAVSDFGGHGTPQQAYDAITNQSLNTVVAGLGLAGLLSLIFAMLYPARQAMRAGLLTRFVGTLGMALAIGALLPPFQQIAVMIYVAVLAPAVLGWLPGGRPPAWEEGRAIPWPTPARRNAARTDPEAEQEPDDLPEGAPTREPRRNRKRRKR